MEANKRIKGIIILSFLIPILSFSQSHREVYNYIREVGIEHPSIVYAQSIAETGHYNSVICRENHNIFGMKKPTQRRTLATGVNRGHATYDTWKQSIFDYWLWQKYYYKGGNYYEFLEGWGYATSKDYINLLKSIKK